MAGKWAEGSVTSGRVAVITGAASGIGRATAEGLAASNVRVLATDVDAGRLAWAEGVDGIESLAVDVRSETDNGRMVQVAYERFGRLDVVVLNAGRPASGPIDELPIEELDEVLSVNLRGVVLGIRAAVPGGVPVLRCRRAESFGSRR